MPFRFYVFYTFFTLIFLFYPGNPSFFHLFAVHREAFYTLEEPKIPQVRPVPYLANAQSTPAVSAQGVYVVDLASFTPVYQRNMDTPFLPASTTKIMTALVARELFSLDDVVTIDRVNTIGQTMGLVRGERITVENLLYGALVQSGNDAADAIADHYGYEDFITKMNEKAVSLGMDNSNFVNASGLDGNGQVASPKDLALAAREVLNDPVLKKMVGTKQINISDVDFTIYHQLNNVNQLLGQIPGLGGLKTGYTEAAGENLISFYKIDEQKQFVIVVLKSEDRFSDTRTIVNWIQENVSYRDVVIEINTY